jgi:peptide/nickel transport system permease protein
VNAVAEVLTSSSAKRRKSKDLLVHWRHSPGALIGAGIVLFFLFLAIFGPSLPFLPAATAQNLEMSLQPPVFAGGTWAHPLGTDALGRDVLSQIVAGARVSMEIGTAAVAISALVGVTVGMLAAYCRRRSGDAVAGVAECGAGAK